ncbi:uncharacterized protein LOC136032242 [Artemia franciscana]|uniref:PH domain-containing protein n=1 Tax=Artemia franciscana TaxID=6661 RepID=A0AA88LCL6_ARTSF|nr:hypothetical protein QYM36_000072 [Artemia franciscana]
MDTCLVLEGRVKFRDKKKWKPRWGILSRLSPVADSLTLQLYKDAKDRTKGGPTKSTLALEHFFGTESGFTLEKESHTISIICRDVIVTLAFEEKKDLLTWMVKITSTLGSSQPFTASLLSVPPRSRLRPGLVRLHLRDWKFAVTEGIPPRLLGIWNLQDLRRYGAIEGGRFCFEAGARSLPGLEGLFVLSTPSCEELASSFNMAARGRLDGRRPSYNSHIHNTSDCSSPRIMRSVSRVESRMSQCSYRYDWNRDSTILKPVTPSMNLGSASTPPRSNLSSPTHYSTIPRNVNAVEDVSVYEQLIYEKAPISQLYDTPSNIPLWAKSPFKMTLTPQPARKRDPMEYYDVPRKLQNPIFFNYDIPPSTPRTVSRPPSLDSSPEEAGGIPIVKMKLDGLGRMPTVTAQPLYAIVDKNKKKSRIGKRNCERSDSSEMYMYMKPLDGENSEYLKMQLEKQKSLRFYSLNRVKSTPPKTSNSLPTSPLPNRTYVSLKEAVEPVPKPPLVAIRRSASVPNKANRDSSSSDSGLSVGSGAEPQICHHASLPRKFLPTLSTLTSESKESPLETKTSVCNQSISSSGTSDLLDYIETISISSDGSGEKIQGSVRNYACTLRPRSGPEYAPLKQKGC